MFNMFKEDLLVRVKMGEIQEQVERNQFKSLTLQSTLSKVNVKKSYNGTVCCTSCCPAVN